MCPSLSWDVVNYPTRGLLKRAAAGLLNVGTIIRASLALQKLTTNFRTTILVTSQCYDPQCHACWGMGLCVHFVTPMFNSISSEFGLSFNTAYDIAQQESLKSYASEVPQTVTIWGRPSTQYLRSLGERYWRFDDDSCQALTLRYLSVAHNFCHQRGRIEVTSQWMSFRISLLLKIIRSGP